ncbi:protein IWS1 homolog isoform X2 [Trichomycterus rosablanca]|uniref:protein IWS1 homolog isoform X2 n=1 Tax=Trichomycterus rosablanca TaxID=2290929 RepID=UPI002F35909D
MDGEEDSYSVNHSDEGSATPVQDEPMGSDAEDERPESRQSEDDGSDREGTASSPAPPGDDSESEPEGGRGGADSDDDGGSPRRRRGSTSETEEQQKERASDSENEEPRTRRSDSDDSDGEKARRRDSDDEDEDQRRKAAVRSDSEDEEERKPRAAVHSDSEDEEVKKPKATVESDSEDEEERKPRAAVHSDSEDEEVKKPKATVESDSEDEEVKKPRAAVHSDSEDDEVKKPKAAEHSDSDEGEVKRRKAAVNSDSEDDEEEKKKPKARIQSDSEDDEEPKNKDEAGGEQKDDKAASDSDDDDVPVKRKKAILSDSEDEDEPKAAAKKRRAVSDDEDSGSDEGSEAPDKSVAAKLRELGSDSEDEDGTNTGGGKKDEKDLFGSDSESENEEEEKMIADIFGESGDEDEEEFTGFNQEELEGEKQQAQAAGQKTVADDSDSDEGVERGGHDMSFMSDFDIMLAKKKAQSGKRRRHRDGGTFISDADDVVSAMITKMNEAAEEDRTLNSQKKPALKKLMLLPTVVMHLKKQDLKETFIDSGVMTAIKEWIGPLPDKSLPALRIREELLKILQELPSVSQETLKMSGIGRAVMFLYKHPKESRPNKDLALKLINEWSRPIFGLSSNYKGMTREERQQRDLDQQVAPRRRLSSGGQTPRRDLEKVLTGEEKALRPGEPGFCARARVPMPSNKDYVVRPKWNVESESSRGSMRKGVSRVDKQMRRFADIRRLTKPGHAVKISVEGNRMPL